MKYTIPALTVVVLLSFSAASLTIIIRLQGVI